MKFGSVVSVWMMFLNHLARISLSDREDDRQERGEDVQTRHREGVEQDLSDRAQLRRVLHHHLEPLQADELAFGERDRRLVVIERVDPAEQRDVAEQEDQDQQRRDVEPQLHRMLPVSARFGSHLRRLLRGATVAAAQFGFFGGFDFPADDRRSATGRTDGLIGFGTRRRLHLSSFGN